jgi:hypothetical protein
VNLGSNSGYMEKMPVPYTLVVMVDIIVKIIDIFLFFVIVRQILKIEKKNKKRKITANRKVAIYRSLLNNFADKRIKSSKKVKLACSKNDIISPENNSGLSIFNIDG